MSAKFSVTFPFQLDSTIAPAAPAFAAASTKLCPSKFSPRNATNNSRGLRVRESVLTLSIRTVPSPEEIEASASVAISESVVLFMMRSTQSNLELHRVILDRTSRDLDIVKRDSVIRELLIIFVSLACDQHNVARACERNGAVDGLGAIDNFFIAIRAKSLFDLGDDRVWIFLARIIRGDDGVVSKAICHLGHQRALLPVAIAAGAKNGNQAMRLQLPESF